MKDKSIIDPKVEAFVKDIKTKGLCPMAEASAIASFICNLQAHRASELMKRVKI